MKSVVAVWTRREDESGVCMKAPQRRGAGLDADGRDDHGTVVARQTRRRRAGRGGGRIIYKKDEG